MKRIIGVLFFCSSLIAAESWELTVSLNHGVVTLENSRIIEGQQKESRRPQAESGPASKWKWQILDANGSILRESRFLFPLEQCAGDAHIQLDSGTAVIVIPALEGGVKATIIESLAGQTVPVGAVVHQRAAESVLAEFPLHGGSK